MNFFLKFHFRDIFIMFFYLNQFNIFYMLTFCVFTRKGCFATFFLLFFNFNFLISHIIVSPIIRFPFSFLFLFYFKFLTNLRVSLVKILFFFHVPTFFVSHIWLRYSWMLNHKMKLFLGKEVFLNWKCILIILTTCPSTSFKDFSLFSVTFHNTGRKKDLLSLYIEKGFFPF